jgi:hypothetical protein
MNNYDMLFTIEQCDEIIKYYSPLVIGKNTFNDVKIEKLIIENCGNEGNMVYCTGKRTHPLNFRKSIILVAINMNLPHPNDFLKTINQ